MSAGQSVMETDPQPKPLANAASPANAANAKRRVQLNPTLVALLLAIALFLLGGLLQPGFTSYAQATNILRVTAFLGIVAAGQTLVIISGNEGIDLSVGALVTLGAMLTFRLVNGHNELVLPVLVVISFIGLVIGAVNGLGVTVLRIPPLVMTLGMTGVIQGAILAITQGNLTGATAPVWNQLIARPLLFDMPGVVFVWVLIGVAMWVVLERTPYGKQLFAIGTNRTTARLSGIHVPFMTVLTYALSGLLAAFGGAVLLGYAQNVYINLGTPYTLPSVAAVVMGGTLLAGGKGSYFGTMSGALVLTLVTSLLTTLQLPEYARQIVYGLILLALLSVYGRQRSLRQ